MCTSAGVWFELGEHQQQIEAVSIPRLKHLKTLSGILKAHSIFLQQKILIELHQNI